MLTFGIGVPSMTVASYESFLKNARPASKMLGDCDSWDELDQFGSIIVGSPATVRKRLWELIEQAQIGNFLPIPLRQYGRYAGAQKHALVCERSRTVAAP